METKRLLFPFTVMIFTTILADTNIILNNKTPFTIELHYSQTGNPLTYDDHWWHSSDSIAPNTRKKILHFNRNIGIKSGRDYYFTTAVLIQSQAPITLELKQKLVGLWGGSTLYQSASGTGFSGTFNDSFFNNTNKHVHEFSDGINRYRLTYQAYYTGGYDDIEYIFEKI